MASRKKQLKRLKKDAQRLWSDQQQLLVRANDVAHDAWPHAQQYARTAVGPQVQTVLDDRVKPAVDRGVKVGKAAGTAVGSTAKDVLFGSIVPAVSSVAAAAITLAEEAADRIPTDDLAKRGHKAAKKLDKLTKSGHKSELKARAKLKAAGKAAQAAAKLGSAKKSGPGAGTVVLIVVGATAAAGIGYAVWQTLRADDDLWVADEDPETTPTSEPPTA